MTHPFDSEAIEAGAKAIRSDCFDPEVIKFFEDLWCRTGREKARESAKAALTAAWASLVERGNAEFFPSQKADRVWIATDAHFIVRLPQEPKA